MQNVQKEVQRIHQEKIVPPLNAQTMEDDIVFSLTIEEAEILNDFLNMFAYD